MPSHQIQTEFSNLLESAVKEGLANLAAIIGENSYLGSYHSFPTISYHENGMPSFYENLFGGPKDYTSAFRGSGMAYTPQSPLIPREKIPSLKTLVDFVRNNQLVQQRLVPEQLFWDPEKDEKYDFVTFSTEHIFEKLVDRYVHINKTFNFDYDSYSRIATPHLKGIFDEKLYIDICVPILFLKFDFDLLEIDGNNTIERMDEPFQLARASKSAYGPSVHKSVLPAATHMLVMKGWYIQNSNQWDLSNLFTETSVYPIEAINNFFASLRIMTGHATGYAQVLMRPVQWSKTFVADLPSIEGTSIRAYPPRFEHYYWNVKEIPIIDHDEAANSICLFDEINKITENSIHVAIRRLNLCFLRETEEDSVLDATIGLEALLSDDDKQEMTHKLAMRIAALTKVSDKFPHTPIDAYKYVKSIYAYRSAVVHGSTKSDKKRVIQFVDRPAKEASTLALEYLRLVLEILIIHPKFRKPADVDKFLLEGCLAQ